jgi:hypothetical protein
MGQVVIKMRDLDFSERWVSFLLEIQAKSRMVGR